MVKIEENSRNVPVDLREDPPPFPEPTSFNWRKDGQPLVGLALTYSNVTFTTIERQDTGNYTVIATNFVLDDPTQQVGNDTGSFYLDVICKYTICYFSCSCITPLLVVSRWTITFYPWSLTALCTVG